MPAPVRTDPASLQFAANVEVIIDFPVKGNREAPALALHRLRAGFGEIEDRQTAVSEGNAAGGIGPDTAGVRTAMPKRAPHPRRIAGERALIAAAGAQKTCDAAHQLVSSARPRSTRRSCH